MLLVISTNSEKKLDSFVCIWYLCQGIVIRDNPLSKVVPVTRNRTNGIWGRCFLTKGQLSISQKRGVILRLAPMPFVFLSFAIDKDS